MLKRTPLYSAHQKLGARLVEFGGWEMPVQYTSIMEEHQTVRRAAGIFDISHMGEVLIAGPRSLEFLNRLLTNDAGRLAVGQGQYTLMCNDTGGVIDDLYAYRIEEQKYLLIINASRIEADLAWMEAQFRKHVSDSQTTFQDVSGETAAVAVQGPRVAEFIDDCFAGEPFGGTVVDKISDLRKNEGTKVVWDGYEVWVARTGYTGEDGFEIVVAAGAIEGLWERLLEAGRGSGLKAAGLGARDTLRTEACFPLYGHELNEQITPVEAGLGFFVALQKGEFNGRQVLEEQKSSGVARRCIAFKMTGASAPPRPHYSIWSSAAGEARMGEVTSGTLSPTLGVGIGMGYVPTAQAQPGTNIQIEIRGRRSPAVIVPKPIYKKPV